jgi:uncharacterized membrane protein SpoIIM required for sporulation
LGDRNFANVRIIRRNDMTMFILIIVVLLMGYLVILIRDLQTDTMNLKLAIENVMKKFDNTIGRLDKIKIPKKEDIKED